MLPRQSRTSPRAHAGFTLIELLVVLAFVAVLLTLALLCYFGKIESAKEAVLQEHLRTTRDVIGKFYGDTGRFPETLDELVEKNRARVPFDPITESHATWALIPVPDGYTHVITHIFFSSLKSTT